MTVQTIYDKIKDLITTEMGEFPKSYFTLLDEVEELRKTVDEQNKENEEMQDIVKWEAEKWMKYFKVEELEKKVKEHENQLLHSSQR